MGSEHPNRLLHPAPSLSVPLQRSKRVIPAVRPRQVPACPPRRGQTAHKDWGHCGGQRSRGGGDTTCPSPGCRHPVPSRGETRRAGREPRAQPLPGHHAGPRNPGTARVPRGGTASRAAAWPRAAPGQGSPQPPRCGALPVPSARPGLLALRGRGGAGKPRPGEPRPMATRRRA